MNEFRMKGVPIRHERQFCRQFDPCDLLKQRELAAGFAMQALQHLSLPAAYHSAQLYRAVFQGLPDSIRHWTDYDSAYLSEDAAALPECLWEELIGSEPPTVRQITLFWILTAGYLLAGKTGQ